MLGVLLGRVCYRHCSGAAGLCNRQRVGSCSRGSAGIWRSKSPKPSFTSPGNGVTAPGAEQNSAWPWVPRGDAVPIAGTAGARRAARRGALGSAGSCSAAGALPSGSSLAADVAR